MRSFIVCLALSSVLSAVAWSAPANVRVPEERGLTLLLEKAEKAPARSRCYALSRLVYEMIQYSARQYAAGNMETASETLRRSKEVTKNIRSHVKSDTKKLKETQILLRRAAFRLSDLLRAGDYDDETLIQETLVQLNQAQNDLLLQLFKR